jgi:hypothetical protein
VIGYWIAEFNEYEREDIEFTDIKEFMVLLTTQNTLIINKLWKSIKELAKD